MLGCYDVLFAVTHHPRTRVRAVTNTTEIVITTAKSAPEMTVATVDIIEVLRSPGNFLVER